MMNNNTSILIELQNIEDFGGNDYSEITRMFSIFIRTKLWKDSNEKYLDRVLIIFRIFFGVITKDKNIRSGDVVIEYIKRFRNIWERHYLNSPGHGEWDKIQYEIYSAVSDITIQKQWDKLNIYVEDDNYKEFDKDLIEIFDDFFTNCVKNDEEYYTINYNSIKHMYRGTKGVHDYTWLVPNPEFKNENRWNPEGKCFVYAAIEDTERFFDEQKYVLHGEMVCLKELRAKKGEKITIAKLELYKDKNKKVFDFSYNDISLNDIINKKEKEQGKLFDKVYDEVSSKLESGQIKTDEELSGEIANTIRTKDMETSLIVSRYCGQIFLKMICDKIYIPLDDSEDKDEKLKKNRYGSFHKMANFLENIGYSGIIYPSTRAKLINETGKNIVLFNYKDVKYKENSIKVIICNID